MHYEGEKAVSYTHLEGYSAEYNENDAVAVMDANMDMLGANVTSVADVALQNAVSTNSVYSKNIELTGNEGQSLSKDATVVMMVTPADGTDMQAFAESLTVSKGGSNLALDVYKRQVFIFYNS